MKNILKYYGLIDDPSSIRAYWWSGEGNKNFGDILTPYFIKKITGKDPLLCSGNCLRPYYMIVGSILKRANRNTIIWGSGIIKRNEMVNKPRKILAVRGPITRKRLMELGYECPEIYGDPALLLPYFYKPKSKKKYELGIIPNHKDYELVKNKLNDKNILLINPLDPIEKVIEDIFSCKRTIASSLHGLIVSHTYKIHSLWVEFSNNLVGDGSKFLDYLLSVNIKPYSPLKFKDNLPKIEDVKKEIDIRTVGLKIDTSKLIEVCPFKKDFFKTNS